jgi:hypothetical protein
VPSPDAKPIFYNYEEHNPVEEENTTSGDQFARALW